MATKPQSLTQISLADLKRRVNIALGQIDDVTSTLPPLIALTTEERRKSDGRLRHGEEEALVSILDAADHVPAAFVALASKDGGVDPHRFETDRLRDALNRALTLDDVAATLETLTRAVRDSQLALGGEARRATLAAYPIAKSIAAHDDVVRTKLAPALNYYAAPARLAAMRRNARKKPGPAGP